MTPTPDNTAETLRSKLHAAIGRPSSINPIKADQKLIDNIVETLIPVVEEYRYIGERAKEEEIKRMATIYDLGQVILIG